MLAAPSPLEDGEGDAGDILRMVLGGGLHCSDQTARLLEKYLCNVYEITSIGQGTLLVI